MNLLTLSDVIMHMDTKHGKNFKLLKKYAKKNEQGNLQNLLFKVINDSPSEEKTILAVRTLISHRVNINTLDQFYRETFIHRAIRCHFSKESLVKLISIAENEGFDFSLTDTKRNTVAHLLIHYYSTNFEDLSYVVNNMLEIVSDTSFLSVRNKDGHTVYKMLALKKFTIDGNKLARVSNDKLDSQITQDGNGTIDNANSETKVSGFLHIKQTSSGRNSFKNIDTKINGINKFGTILTDKVYDNDPAIGRDKEIEKLIISLVQDKKMPILVGPSGSGKTAIIDKLAYLIQKNLVPPILIDSIIFEACINSLISGTTYRGTFEKNIERLVEFCVDNNIILFIDEIHTIYGTGSVRNDNGNSSLDMADILKTYIDRYGLKVIGATTDLEYQKFMANDALKRRFDIIKVNEPDNEILFSILENIINYYADNRCVLLDNISYCMNEIITILIELSQMKHRKYNDKLANPDLVISLVDKAFAYAIVYNDSILSIENFIQSINDCDRIYDSAKTDGVLKLRELIIRRENNLNKKALILNIRDFR